ncbi:MAG: VWA domain-containing protein [Terriglobales bacterium]
MRHPTNAVVGLSCFLAASFLWPAQNPPVTNAGAVVLAVTVTDSKDNPVVDLKAEDFTVHEDGQPQQIISVRREDVPVSMGILVDNSGSMRQKRLPVMNGLLRLVEAGNTQDEIFVVNFNDEPFLDVDFTSDITQVRQALARVDSRGGTALFDSVIASADHMPKAAKFHKRVLVVVTDGADNESHTSLQQTIADLQSVDGPAVYTIGIIFDDPQARRARKDLELLAAQTGGGAYFIKNAKDLDKVAQKIAQEIRSQYSVSYAPATPQSHGGFRKINVIVGRKGLTIRAKAAIWQAAKVNLRDR